MLLTENDYLIIKDALSNPNYLQESKDFKVGLTRWHKKYANPQKSKTLQIEDIRMLLTNGRLKKKLGLEE